MRIGAFRSRGAHRAGPAKGMRPQERPRPLASITCRPCTKTKAALPGVSSTNLMPPYLCLSRTVIATNFIFSHQPAFLGLGLFLSFPAPAARTRAHTGRLSHTHSAHTGRLYRNQLHVLTPTRTYGALVTHTHSTYGALVALHRHVSTGHVSTRHTGRLCHSVTLALVRMVQNVAHSTHYTVAH